MRLTFKQKKNKYLTNTCDAVQASASRPSSANEREKGKRGPNGRRADLAATLTGQGRTTASGTAFLECERKLARAGIAREGRASQGCFSCLGLILLVFGSLCDRASWFEEGKLGTNRSSDG